MSIDYEIVYFIGNLDYKKVKIGITTLSNLKSRLSGIQTGCHYKLSVIGAIRCKGISSNIVEKDIHNIFSYYRLEGEWFEIQGFVEAVIHKSFNGPFDGVPALTASAIKQNSKSWSTSLLTDGCVFRVAARSARSKENHKQVIAGLERMVIDSLKRIADLESCIHAMGVSAVNIKDLHESYLIQESNGNRKGHPISSEAREFMDKQYGQEAITEAAYHLKGIFGEIFENSPIGCQDVPVEFN